MAPQIIIIAGAVAFAAAVLAIVKSASRTGDYSPVQDRAGRGVSPVFFVLLVAFFVGLLLFANHVSGGMVAAAIAG